MDGSINEDYTFEEIQACVTKQKRNKATGPDGVPIEQHQYSQTAIYELHNILLSIFQTEVIPDDLVLADMMMHYKKKCKDTRANYRALGLLNHGYKTFAAVLLGRMLPYQPKTIRYAGWFP